MPAISDGSYHASDHGLTVTARVLPGEGRRALVGLTGDIDMAASALLSTTVEWLTTLAPSSVLVDLADVTFASAMLPNFLVQMRRAVPDGAEIVLWRPRPATGWVLRVTDMRTLATVRDHATEPYAVRVRAPRRQQVMTTALSTAGRGRVSAQAASSFAEERLVVRLSRLARALQEVGGVDATLQAITHAAVTTIPGAGYAAISVVRRREEIRTLAPTAALALDVDHVQYDTGQGPCLDAIHEQHTVRLTDMRTETRWPRFTPQAAQLGVLSMLSLQLFVHSGNLGALNLYASQPDAFTDESEQVGRLFAAHAAVAMSGAQHHAHLTVALAARDVIGQAKGILMERYRLTAGQAFAVLADASQKSNTKLVDIAHKLAETGELPGARPEGRAGNAARHASFR